MIGSEGSVAIVTGEPLVGRLQYSNLGFKWT